MAARVRAAHDAPEAGTATVASIAAAIPPIGGSVTIAAAA